MSKCILAQVCKSISHTLDIKLFLSPFSLNIMTLQSLKNQTHLEKWWTFKVSRKREWNTCLHNKVCKEGFQCSSCSSSVNRIGSSSSDGQRDLERLKHYLASILRDNVKCSCMQKVWHLFPQWDETSAMTEQSEGRGKARGERKGRER